MGCIFPPKSHAIIQEQEPQVKYLLTRKLRTPAGWENGAASSTHGPDVPGPSGGQPWETQYPAAHEVNQGDVVLPLASSAMKLFGPRFARAS